MRRTLLGALWLLVLLPSPASSCRFYLDQRTLRDEVGAAKAIVQVRLTRATPPNPDGEGGEWVTDFVIEKTLKRHPLLAGRDTLTISRHISVNNGVPQRFLLFVDIDNNGRPDPYRGIPLIARSDLPRYIQGILRIKGKKTTEQLRFYFDYLHHAEQEIARDAGKEFEKAAYKDYRAVAETLPADWLAAWLRDPKTPVDRIGLFTRLLGHCSKNKEQDAKLLRKLLNDPKQSGVNGILEGLLLLQPKRGWQEVCKLMENASADFVRRYAALRAARFVKDYRPDLVPPEEVIKEVAILLDQKDIVDLAIEDFRKWKRWDLTQRILSLRDREGYEHPIIPRAILRFALSSPDQAAKRYVEEQRKRDEQSVLDAEELLKIEQQNTQTPATK